MGNNTRRYIARAEQWGIGETDSGKPQVAVGFQILTEGADPGYITWHGYFTEKTADRTIESLRLCGWQGDDLTELTDSNPAANLSANEVELVIEDETYEGKTRAKVQWVNRPGGALALKAPLVGDKLKAFAAEMRQNIRAFDAAKGVKRPAARPQSSTPPPPHIGDDAAPPLTDDDIPF